MTTRTTIIAGAALLLLAAAAGAWLWPTGPSPDAEAAEDTQTLPLPPLPARIAGGEDYDRCLAMLNDDPAAASGFAEGWEATGGGEPATHCLALSKIGLGEPARAAAMLEKLAATSHGPTAARAALYAQATQAWEMADDIDHALGAATMALALSPDNPDLLIDRAVVSGSKNQFRDAIEDLTKALSADNRRADALTFRAAAWRHLEDLDRAQGDVDRALAIDPDSADALLERGILRQRRNDQAGARADWERAIELAPDTATADLAQQNIALLDAGPERR